MDYSKLYHVKLEIYLCNFFHGLFNFELGHLDGVAYVPPTPPRKNMTRLKYDYDIVKRKYVFIRQVQ